MAAIDHLAAKMDILTQRIDKMSMNALSTLPSISCEICGCMGHTAMECQLGNFNSHDPSMEHINYVSNFNQKIQSDPFSNTNNPGEINQISPTTTIKLK